MGYSSCIVKTDNNIRKDRNVMQPYTYDVRLLCGSKPIGRITSVNEWGSCKTSYMVVGY